MTETAIVSRAVAAAQAVAAANDVPCDDAVVVAAGSNVLVHLEPAPVIARVMTGTAELHADVERWLTGEVAVGAFLGGRGLAVSPSDVLPPGPHHHDGLWMTFWDFVEHNASERLPSAHELGDSLRAMHDALAEFPGELGPLSDVGDWLDRIATDGLRVELHTLTPSVFKSSLPAQAIHGDTSMGNLLRTGDRLLWNDLEDVCRGPVEWDVAGLVADARASGAGEQFVGEFLRAYGGVELERLDNFIAAHDLYARIWHAFADQPAR